MSAPTKDNSLKIETSSWSSTRRALSTRGGTAPRKGNRVQWTFLLLALPAAAVYVGFLLGPVIGSFGYALTRWDGIGDPSFVGIANFATLIGDENYRSALAHTLVFAVVIVAGQIGFGVLLAVLLNKSNRGTSVLRATLFTPALLSAAVVSLIWGFIFNPLVGVLVQVLTPLGVKPGVFGNLLGNPTSVIFAVSAVVIWQYAGYIMVIYLAGLKNIPPEVGEAADLDGATGWRRFWSVTWPMLAPSTTVAITISLAGNLRLFDQVFLLTGGGPADASQTAATLVYRTAFSGSNFGYSASQSVVLTLLICLVVFGQRWIAVRRAR